MRFVKIPYELIERGDLNYYEFRLLITLLQKESKFNKEGKWFDVGYADIPMHHSTINKYRQSLKEKGLIDYKNGYSLEGKKCNSQYLIKVDKDIKEETTESPKTKDNKPKTRVDCFGREIPMEEF